MSARISVDILFKSGVGIPTVHTIDEFRARTNDVVLCRNWLASKGLTSHETGFGLACAAERHQLEEAFQTKIVGKSSNLQFSSKPIIPERLDAIIDRITISRPPELFL